MSTWSGWQSQLLNRAGFAVTPGNSDFLTDWGKAEASSCKANPVIISWPLKGSTRCKPLGIRSLYVQNYTSHAQGASAFDQQLRQDNYTHLIAAFHTGNPYNLTDTKAKGVYDDLLRWGAYTMARNYALATFDSAVPGANSPRAHGGWADLQRSVNRNMPAALAASRRNTRAALRSLSRARRVRW